MKDRVIYTAPDITKEQLKIHNQSIKEHQELLKKRAKMTPEERKKQDRKFAGLFSKMQSDIDI